MLSASGGDPLLGPRDADPHYTMRAWRAVVRRHFLILWRSPHRWFDIVFWPLVVLAQYLIASGDGGNGNTASGGNVSAFGSVHGGLSSGHNSAGNGGDGS